MIDRALAKLGIDPLQWRMLALTYVRMDVRSAGGATRRHARGRAGASPLIGLAIVSLIGSVAFALIAVVAPDPLLSASLLTTYAAANTMVLLLVDFTGVVISPDDYGILGARPVDSRTYFAARLAAVFVYVGTIGVVTGLLPAIVYAVRFGPVAGIATVVAVLLCDLSVAVLVITAYVVVVQWVHPARLRRALGYLQLAAGMSFYGTYYLATVGFRAAFFDRFHFEGAPWLWSVPSTWFAAIVAVGAGRAGRAAWIAAAAAAMVTLGCLPLAAGRLSLDYARRIGEMTAVAEPARRRGRAFLPFFRRNEARAVALLVRAQFRFDQRYRMAILGILPLTAFYLLLGSRDGVRDPFNGFRAGGPGVFFAVVFIPITLHAAMTVSESWRAAWVFFATPASRARVVVAAKNVVSIYFIGAYVVALAIFWSFFFDRMWHAVVHALFAGLMAHLLLQLAVIARPALPFAAESRKAERSFSAMGVILVGSIAAGLMPAILPFVYRDTAVTVGALAFVIALTAGFEYALRLRVDEAIGDLEFTA
jgi:hypothetical protein